MGLHLFFLPNLPGATFIIQKGTFIPDSRVYKYEIDGGTHCVFVLCVLVQGSNHNNTSF